MRSLPRSVATFITKARLGNFIATALTCTMVVVGE
jgi:hypothetical protein